MINTNNIQISKHNHPMKITVNVLSGETFIIPHLSGYDYDYRVDWGDGTWDRIYDYNDSGTTHNYISGVVYSSMINFDTSLKIIWKKDYTTDELKTMTSSGSLEEAFLSMVGAAHGSR